MSPRLAVSPHTRFQLPAALSAADPPESRGLARDQVRLLVATGTGLHHVRFRELPRFLDPGDLLVVNTSATVPAAVDGVRRTGDPVVVHFSTPSSDGSWVVELRAPTAAGQGPVRDGAVGERLRLTGGATVTLTAGFPDGGAGTGSRLWRAVVEAGQPVRSYLARHGRPIRYGYVARRWPLADYQTVFATHPGSAEMPSAGRAFTADVVTRLVAAGVLLAPLVLHTGVSSPDADEPPYPEWYDVPEPTARLVAATRAAGHRVVAVGTTVVRALETATGVDGDVRAGAGWTDLVLGPERRARAVDGLLTGWHAPEASHLHLLESVVGPDLVQRAYDAALAHRYLWHEFGDTCLFLP